VVDNYKKEVLIKSIGLELALKVVKWAFKGIFGFMYR